MQFNLSQLFLSQLTKNYLSSDEVVVPTKEAQNISHPHITNPFILQISELT